MKNIRKALRAIVSLALAVLIMFPIMTSSSQTITAEAAGTYTLDESFVPSRSFYPFYISRYSDYDSELIKGLWERIFYEETYVNTNWSSKYYVDNTTNYVGIDGNSKSFAGIRFSSATGDFDAFLGNTLVANPEFLGELLGISGYSPVVAKSDPSKTTDLQNAMKATMYNKMVNPGTYTYFAKAMAELTKNGLYLTDNKLTTVSYNGQPFDVWMICCLASLYEGDGSETYLSPTQVTWLKNQQLRFYDAYTANTNLVLKQIVRTYRPIYDLIARSAYASIDRNGYGQEFFNYVENSGYGAGAWINAALSSKISGLDDVGSIQSLFAFSNGFCYGNEAASSCTNHSLCLPVESHGRATVSDLYAYKLNKVMQTSAGSLVKRYITNNAATNEAYQTGGESWTVKYTIHHSPGSASGTYYTETIGNTKVEQTPVDGAWYFDGYTGPDGTGDSYCNRATATATITIGPEAFSSTAYAISTKLSGEYSEDDYSWSWDAYTTVNGRTYSIKDKISRTGFPEGSRLDARAGLVDTSMTFNIANVTPTERKNAKIVITASASHYEFSHFPPYHTQGPNKITCSHSSNPIIVTYKRPKCALVGHNWVIDNNNSGFSSDNKSAKITVYCSECFKNGRIDPNPTITTKDYGSYILYTATSKQIMVNGSYASISKRIYKNATGSGSESFSINTSNSSGDGNINPFKAGEWGRDVVYASGADSWGAGGHLSNVYKEANAYLKVTAKSGLIKAGAKSVTVGFNASETCETVEITVKSSTGRTLGNINKAKTGDRTITVPIYGATDSDLNGAYVIISIHSCTHHSAPQMYVEPNDVYTETSVNSLAVNYQ